MNLFNVKIANWEDWGGIFQSIPAFAPLVYRILDAEGLPRAKIEGLTPGTNAVFKVGSYVVKVFAPAESGYDQTPDLKTELFATRRANALGVSAPRLVAGGFVEDKYRFEYIVTDFIEGAEFPDAVKGMAYGEKLSVGRKLRAVTDLLNTSCEAFNVFDAVCNEGRFPVWDKFPAGFNAERAVYKRTHDFGEKVFAHGDLCGDNILVTPGGELFIIDFADSVLAPVSYEHALVAVELFDMDPALLRGFFGECPAGRLADICFDGLLIHAFGGGIIEHRLGDPSSFAGIGDLRTKLLDKLPA